MSKRVTVWVTGRSWSGKTTVATRVHDLVRERHIHAERLDGDVVRKPDQRLRLLEKDRDRNIERVTFVARLLPRNGVIVLTAFI